MTRAQFATAYESSFRRTVHFLMSKGVSRADAEEVAQAAWTKGWQRRSQLRQQHLLSTWVNTIALNLLRNQLRQDSRTEELSEVPDCRNDYSLVALRIDAQKLLSRCKSVDQALLLTHYVAGYTTAEAGRKQGLRPTTTRVRLMRIRDRLRQFLRVPKDGRKQTAAPQASGLNTDLRSAAAVISP